MVSSGRNRSNADDRSVEPGVLANGAPELLVAECATILWKKVRRKELSRDAALLAARLLQGAEIELVPTRSLLEAATRLAIELEHPAYDCLYLRAGA